MATQQINLARPSRYFLVYIGIMVIVLLIGKEDVKQGNRTKDEQKTLNIFFAVFVGFVVWGLSALRN